MPSLLALLGLVAGAGFQNRDKIRGMLGEARGRVPAGGAETGPARSAEFSKRPGPVRLVFRFMLVQGVGIVGLTVALVSDAGTPLLSDPGFVLIREAAAQGVRVEPLPGPSAVLAALVVSGLPPYPFTFAGFPPPKAGKRRSFYARWAGLGHTLVLFESPHRLLASLEDALAELGDRPAAVGRELTKLHEEVLRGRLSGRERAPRDRGRGDRDGERGRGDGSRGRRPRRL